MKAEEPANSGHYANVILFPLRLEKPEDMSYTYTGGVIQKREGGFLHRPVENTTCGF